MARGVQPHAPFSFRFQVMSRPPQLTIACPNFTAQEKQSVRALLLVLANHLPVPCTITDADTGDLYLVNLDEDAPKVSLPDDAYIVGCAAKPRLHPAGTIHQPVRPSALLAVLSDYLEKHPGGAPKAAPGAAPAKVQKVEWSYRLLAWPLDFQQMSTDYWRVMAYLARHNADAAGIEKATRLSAETVQACLQRLNAAGLLHRSAITQTMQEATASAAAAPAASVAPPAPPAPSGWRKLASRMSNLLGFKR